jgi:hypothetical protein
LEERLKPILSAGHCDLALRDVNARYAEARKYNQTFTLEATTVETTSLPAHPSGCYSSFFSTYMHWINSTNTTTATSTSLQFNVTANATYTASSQYEYDYQYTVRTYWEVEHNNPRFNREANPYGANSSIDIYSYCTACPIAPGTVINVRIQMGGSTGPLQVRVRDELMAPGSYGYVCAEGLDKVGAGVACRQMGFAHGRLYPAAFKGATSFALFSAACTGVEL